MELQADAAKNYLWRSSTIITPRTCSSNSHHNKGKAPMPHSTSERQQPIVFKQQTFGSHDSFGANGSKVFLTLWDLRDILRMLKQTLKGLLNPLPSTSISSENVASVGAATLGTKPRNDWRLMRSTNVVIEVFVWIVVRLVIWVMTVLSQSRDSLTVL